MVTGFLEFNTKHNDVCKGCALGKYTKTSFQSNDCRSERVLELIHSDLCGPMSSASLTGYEYYITFIDDFSKKTWIYFLRNKRSEEVLLQFQEFKALVGNQTKKKAKVLRSNNGGEYTSHAFDEFCRQEGIRR